jgi:hypothetical protein
MTRKTAATGDRRARAARLGETLVLSPADREAFFDGLVHPPKPNARLVRALRAEKARVEPESADQFGKPGFKGQ